MLVVAALLSMVVKFWADSGVEGVAPGCGVLLLVWPGKRSAVERPRQVSGVLTGSYRG